MSPEEILALDGAAEAPEKVEVYREEACGGDCSPPYEFKYDPDMAAPRNRTADEIIEEEKDRIAALCRLSIPHGTPFEKLRMQAYYHLGHLATQEYVTKYLLVDGLTSMAEVRQAEKYLQSVLEDEERTAEEKLSACRILADVEEMRANLGNHLVDLSEKAATKGQNGRKRNLPPVPGSTMINVPGQNATVVLQHANNGVTGVQPQPQSHD